MDAFEQILKNLPRCCRPILEAIWELGPTHNNRILEYLNQKEKFKPRRQRRTWQINQVCSRVNDLVNVYSVVADIGRHKGKWYGKNKTYHIWRAVDDKREPDGWNRLPDKEQRQRKPPAQILARRADRLADAVKPVLTAMAASEAGMQLVAHRYSKLQNTQSKKQLPLFE